MMDERGIWLLALLLTALLTAAPPRDSPSGQSRTGEKRKLPHPAGAAAETVEKPLRPKDSEGGDVCRGTVRVPLRVQSNPNLQLFEVANS